MSITCTDLTRHALLLQQRFSDSLILGIRHLTLCQIAVNQKEVCYGGSQGISWHQQPQKFEKNYTLRLIHKTKKEICIYNHIN